MRKFSNFVAVLFILSLMIGLTSGCLWLMMVYMSFNWVKYLTIGSGVVFFITALYLIFTPVQSEDESDNK
jgi:hypothetical protein